MTLLILPKKGWRTCKRESSPLESLGKDWAKTGLHGTEYTSNTEENWILKYWIMGLEQDKASRIEWDKMISLIWQKFFKFYTQK